MKYRYKINHLDCANCAKRIEDALNNDKDLKATVNFAKLSLTIETDFQGNVKKKAQDIIKNTEDGVVIYSLDEEVKTTIKWDIARLVIGLLLFGLSFIIKNNLVHQIIIILAYVILLVRVFKKALLMLIKNFQMDENLLVTISCVGAYFTNNIHEGLMVIILYEIGKILESMAVNNSRKSISDLMDIKPEYANLEKDNKILKVNPSEVKVNDIIVVKKGEKIPLDGIVIEGQTKLDNKALTGESRLVEINKKDSVLSGSINMDNLIKVKVSKEYEDSTVAQILALVENATDKKAKTENFVAKAAKIYTPIILVLAILIALVLPLFNIPFNQAIYRALVFLVVSCPCAIAISVPLSYFSGIGISSKNGILVKGSNFLEASSNIEEIIFDKTGTITTGEDLDYHLEILNKKYQKEDILKYFVSGEVLSNHPIAKNILTLFADVKPLKVTNFKEITGKGITFDLKKEHLKIGSAAFCEASFQDKGIFLKVNDDLVAKLIINDGIKQEAKETINTLKRLGLKVKMFTGDNKDIALDIAKKVEINDVEYELLPQDKFKLLEKEIKKYNVAFVGDGINDAPALKIAKVGISMGSIGSASAIEASDIVIMNDNLESLPILIKISKKTKKIIIQNLIFALGIKLLVLILSGLGIASMWQAVFADTGVTLLTILNTTRILKGKYK